MERRTVVMRLVTVVFSAFALLSTFMANKDLKKVNAYGSCPDICPECSSGPRRCCYIDGLSCYDC